MIRGSLTVLFLLALAVSATIEPPVRNLETMIAHGPAREKVDMILIGDGYTAAETAKWHEDARQTLERLKTMEPFCTYWDFFNFHRLDIISNQSGAGNRPGVKDNALGSRYNCSNIERLICIDDKRVARAVDAVMNREEQDIIAVIVNDRRYGGSGGRYATASMSALSVRILVHEIGHSFAGLADEYDSGYSEEYCRKHMLLSEPSAPNATLERDPARVKWLGVPGAGVFEGAMYCRKGLYRPYKTSLMRDLNAPFRRLHMQVWDARIRRLAKGTVQRNCPPIQ